MSWQSGRISLTNITNFRKCPQLFDWAMKKYPGKYREAVKKAQDFGISGEKLWDEVILGGFLSESRDVVESVFTPKLDILINQWRGGRVEVASKDPAYESDSFEKVLLDGEEEIRNGFWETWLKLRAFFNPGYVVKTQTSFKEQVGSYLATGKSDYIVENFLPDSTSEFILLEAKGYSKRDPYKSVNSQLLHYSSLIYKMFNSTPRIVVFYFRLGLVEEKVLTLDSVQKYLRFLEGEHNYIKHLRVLDVKDNESGSVFKATPSNFCYICPYTLTCKDRPRLKHELGRDFVEEVISNTSDSNYLF